MHWWVRIIFNRGGTSFSASAKVSVLQEALQEPPLLLSAPLFGSCFMMKMRTGLQQLATRSPAAGRTAQSQDARLI
ncbi:hypothetical protein PFLUV_G00074640 [Perca fluviatilis]|uniref:Uncharacterized protein n=1 Tax=Perca fluviatilis TaxID=8168 RepID=A0A6A5FBB8_PERFL|nr:hypothetical protein PFLUV_G00074640 [Perca fluviatilis]